MDDVTKYPYRLPYGKILLEALSLTEERLRNGSKVAVPIPILRCILFSAIAEFPFDREFYLSAYPDIEAAYNSGEIADLHEHYIEAGYFEGRFGSIGAFDEEYYKSNYPDVAAAIDDGRLPSALDHYLKAGANEGRHANKEDAVVSERWMKLLGRS